MDLSGTRTQVATSFWRAKRVRKVDVLCIVTILRTGGACSVLQLWLGHRPQRQAFRIEPILIIGVLWKGRFLYCRLIGLWCGLVWQPLGLLSGDSILPPNSWSPLVEPGVSLATRLTGLR